MSSLNLFREIEDRPRTHTRPSFLTRAMTGWSVLLVGLIALAGSAQAGPIFSGDQTTLVVTSFFNLTDAGFDLAPLGDARIGDDIVLDQNNGLPRKLAAFPITGGGVSVLTGDVLVEHAGSGLGLSTADPSAGVDIENFQILLDGGAVEGGLLGTLYADVKAMGGDFISSVPVFDITGCGFASDPACRDSDGSLILSGLRLGLTEGASSLLNEIFKTSLFEVGTQIGIARVDVRVVPEPGSFMLTAIGLVGLGLAGSRRA